VSLVSGYKENQFLSLLFGQGVIIMMYQPKSNCNSHFFFKIFYQLRTTVNSCYSGHARGCCLVSVIAGVISGQTAINSFCRGFGFCL